MPFKNPASRRAAFARMNATHPDSHLIRRNLVGEHEAVIQYQDDAYEAANPKTRKVLLDIAREEMTHVGELDALLSEVEPIQAIESRKGKAEIDDIHRKNKKVI